MPGCGDGVGGDDVPIGHHIQAGAGDARIDLAAGQPVGHRILDGIDLNVEVPSDGCFAPGDLLPGGRRQRDHQVLFLRVEEIPATGVPAAERCGGIDLIDSGVDGVIDVIEVNEESLGQGGDDFPGDDLHTGFHRGLIFRLVGPGRCRSRAVVLKKLLVGGVDVPGGVGGGDPVGRGGGIIGDDDLGNPAEVVEGLAVRIKPGAHLLVWLPAGEDHARIRQCGHEHVHLLGFAGDRVGGDHWGAGPVDLHGVCGLVGDHRGQVMGGDVFGDELAKPVVAVVRQASGGRVVEVLGPQLAQGRFLVSASGASDGVEVRCEEVLGGQTASVGE